MTDAASARFRRYAEDGAVVLGGAAAILLQVADPVVARGVAAHSAFAIDPMRRLRHTLTYVYAVGLGTPAQQRRAAAFVDRAHTGVPGATDPDRQLWVAATLYRIGVDTFARLTGPMDAALADEAYARSAGFGTLLQLPAGLWPADRAAFERYWTDAVAGLAVGDDARAVARDLFAARNAPAVVRAGMPQVRTFTASLLPPAIRDAYGLPDDPVAERRTLRLARAAIRVTPHALRALPARRLLARLDG